MNRIDDERITFYYRHQGPIDEWAQARDDAKAMAHAFYLSLAADLEDALPGDDVRVVSEDVTWARVGLARERWFLSTGRPSVTVGLEWRKGDSDFTTGHRWVGVRCDRSLPGGAELNVRIVDLLEGRRVGYPRSTATWPALRTVSGADGEFWLDLAPFRRRLVDEIFDAWATLSVIVDEAIGSGAG